MDTAFEIEILVQWLVLVALNAHSWEWCACVWLVGFLWFTDGCLAFWSWTCALLTAVIGSDVVHGCM